MFKQEFTAASPFVVNIAATLLAAKFNQEVDDHSKMFDIASKVYKKFSSLHKKTIYLKKF